MTREEIFERLRSILVEEFSMEPGKIHPEATLRGTLGMHSIQLVSLAVLLEDAYPEVAASGDDFDRYVGLASVGDVVSFVMERVQPS